MSRMTFVCEIIISSSSYFLVSDPFYVINWSSYLDCLDCHQTGSIIATDLVSLSFPHLAKVSLAQHSLQPESGPGELPDGAEHVSSSGAASLILTTW